jgi:hypothetical protein
MVSINCRPDRSGFSYKVSGPEGAKFWATYLAIGTGGHQTVGDLAGIASDADEWIFKPVHFPVMHAAITGFGLEAAPTDVPQFVTQPAERELPYTQVRELAPTPGRLTTAPIASDTEATAFYS